MDNPCCLDFNKNKGEKMSDEQREFIFFDQEAGRQEKEKGIARAVDHADRELEKWSVLARELFREYITLNSEFGSEDVRAWAHNIKGLPFPPDNRAWGGIVLHFAKCKKIIRIGYAPAKEKKSHCGPQAIWRVVK